MNIQTMEEFKEQLADVKMRRTQEIAITIQNYGKIRSSMLITAPDIKMKESGAVEIVGNGVYCIHILDEAEQIIRLQGEVYPVYQLSYGKSTIEYIFLSATQDT